MSKSLLLHKIHNINQKLIKIFASDRSIKNKFEILACALKKMKNQRFYFFLLFLPEKKIQFQHGNKIVYTRALFS